MASVVFISFLIMAAIISLFQTSYMIIFSMLSKMTHTIIWLGAVFVCIAVIQNPDENIKIVFSLLEGIIWIIKKIIAGIISALGSM